MAGHNPPSPSPSRGERMLSRFGINVRAISESAALQTVRRLTRRGNELDTAARDAAKDEVQEQLQPGHALRDRVEDIATTAAQGVVAPPAPGVAAPTPPGTAVDDVLAQMQPGAPRYDDFETAVQAMTSSAAVDDVLAEMQPGATRRDDFETAIADLVPPAVPGITETRARELADEQITAAGGVPVSEMVTRRNFLIGLGVTGLSTAFICSIADWAQDALGIPWGQRGQTVIVQQPLPPTATAGQLPPPSTTEQPTIPPNQPGEIPSTRADGFAETGANNTVSLARTVVSGKRLVVFSVGLLGTGPTVVNFTDGIIGAFPPGTYAVQIKDGVYNIWDETAAFNHFVTEARAYIGQPYAAAHVRIPQSWQSLLPADVAAFVNSRDVQYV